jgi:hypothetical protein
MLDPRTRARGILDAERVERLLANGRGGPAWARGRVSFLWKALTVELWHREFVDPAA